MRDVSNPSNQHGDRGSAARFFYQSKPSKKERNEGLPDSMKNNHPTVKPVELIRYLANLILPPPRSDGQPRKILIPYSGSGSEMIGAALAGWDHIDGIEINPEYIKIAEHRMKWWTAKVDEDN